jgi:hypothetical protein
MYMPNGQRSMRSFSCASARLRAVMSRAIFEAPMIRPCWSFTGEIVSEMSSGVPSLRSRTVSK